MTVAAGRTVNADFTLRVTAAQLGGIVITGYGQADKKAVQKLIKLTTNIDISQDDEADAVACGLAYLLLSKNV